MFQVVTQQVVNKATSIATLTSRLWVNINYALLADLALISNLVSRLDAIYTGAVGFSLDAYAVIISDLADDVMALQNSIRISLRSNTANSRISFYDNIGRVKVCSLSLIVNIGFVDRLISR